MKTKIAKRRVESVTPGSRDVLLWNTEIPGFGLKVTPSGRRVYILQHTYGGRSRRCTIGRHGADKTPEEARRDARCVRGRVAKGRDPAGEIAMQIAGSGSDSPSTAIFATLPVTASGHPGNFGSKQRFSAV